jgi:hypothetical protein
MVNGGWWMEDGGWRSSHGFTRISRMKRRGLKAVDAEEENHGAH